MAVLQHPHTKVFIMSGGTNSIEDALVSLVAPIIIAKQYDQYMNCKLMQAIGIAKCFL